MATFSNEMSRLRDEVSNLRQARRAFVADLKNSVSRMRGGFRVAQEEMSRTGKAKGAAFVSAVKHAVFDLRKKVLANRREFAAELERAHRAWCSAFHLSHRSHEKKAEPPKSKKS